MKSLTLATTLILLLTTTSTFAQIDWRKGGNAQVPPGAPSILGTDNSWNAPLQIHTNGIQRAVFTTNNSLSSINGNFGDGLRIINPLFPLGTQGNLDLFTSSIGGLNETHIKFGGNGQISGQENRFELRAFSQGFFFNTQANNGVYKFGRQNNITGFIGTNNFWRIGDQSDSQNLNANRRLEVIDGVWQFRITNTNGSFTDFQTRENGRLNINPTGGMVGINLTIPAENPTATLDVNGNTRIRVVADMVSPDVLIVGKRLIPGTDDYELQNFEFNGNANNVLLGNGTWGAIPTGTISGASNGAWQNPGNDEIEWGTNALIHDTKLPLSGYDVVFQTTNNSEGTVTFGGTTFSPNSRVEIVNDFDGYQNGLRVNSTTSNLIPIKYGINTYANNGNRLFAIYGFAENGNGVNGVVGIARNGVETTIGVSGSASSTSQNGIAYGGQFYSSSPSIIANCGVYATANNSPKMNIGGYFKSATGTTCIGVYGEAASTVGANWGGYFVGGIVLAGPIIIPSDSTLKENIQPINENVDSLLMLLEPKQYEFLQTGNAARLGLEAGQRFGVLAQQVEPLFPDLIRVITHPAEIDSIGNIINPSFQYKAVDIEQMIPLMLFDLKKKNESINSLVIKNDTQDSLIENLNDRLTQLENCLSNLLPTLCQATAMVVESTPQEVQQRLNDIIDVELSDKNNVVLNQNVPNPFAERTVITYSIPETVAKAQIHFYDGMGKLINTVDISERGNGQINVYANDLSTGVYTYSLVTDGQTVATKRMMKQ